MKKRTKAIFTAGIAIIAIIICVILMMNQAQKDVLTKAAIQKKIEASYEGDITKLDTSSDKKTYLLTLENEKGIYELKADAKTGAILDMDRIKRINTPLMTEKEAEQLALAKTPGTITERTQKKDIAAFTIQNEGETYKVKVDKRAKTVVSSEKVSKKGGKQATKISEKEAKAIAVKEVGGKADDADLEESEGTLVFEVDIDLPNDREATVKINAYTGRIVGIVYED
ncbi:PepSY domain-containing protein [Bacillus atrophaeus]|uniref:PepSY domain-containing protein n=1 Tax=Bacillus atrophaeus TaxID=1452 RepID=UPI0007C5B710|nr:PepSY domain-containing protein [Bacillus atrophaeus]WFE15503.1 PepSY domain-containing protein [Bacillus atrophaeus]